jgi:methylated-DNA-[protein]-cysteine S-methyltransferase
VKTITRTVPSPVGDLLLVGDGETLRGLYLAHHPVVPGAVEDEKAFPEAVRQLEEFFAGARTDFDLPLDLAGTDFQRKVWDVLRRIPFGETMSYGEVAREAGYPGSARAVGSAIGRNPVVIVVPCHRVIGADGSLTGYGPGLDRKVTLLEHERVVAQGVGRAS